MSVHMAMKLKCEKYFNSLMSNKCILNINFTVTDSQSIVIDHIERII